VDYEIRADYTVWQFVEKYGRRKCLTAGAAWMFMCFMVFASVGKFGKQDASGNPAQTEGYVLIIFSCLFIAAFASTLGELPRASEGNLLKHDR
jgi:SP family sugar:H+ symporter-like MFS transporter